MWCARQTWKIGRRAAGFLAGLLVALLLAAAPAAGQGLTVLEQPLANGGATTPVVAVTSSGQVYVAWLKGPDVFFTRSKSQGSCGGGKGSPEFPREDEAVNLSDVPKDARGNATQVKALLPSIAANDEGGVIVAWSEQPLGGVEGVDPSVRLRRSATGDLASVGTEVFPKDLQPGLTQVSPTFPAAAADSGGFFVAWQARVASKGSVLVAQSFDGGGFAYTNVTASRTAPASQSQLGVASDGSKLHVVWKEASPSSGIWYTGVTRTSGTSTVGCGTESACQLTTVSGTSLRLAAYGSQVVTAAWTEGGKKLQVSTTTNNGLSFAQVTVRSIDPLTEPRKTLAAPTLNLGPTGRFVAWQERDDAASPVTIKLLSDRVDIRSGDSAMNPAGPSVGQASVGQDGTARLVASWQENSANGIAIRLGHTGSFGGGAVTDALVVRSHPTSVNPQTMAPGSTRRPNFTVFIEPAEGQTWSVSDIVPGSVELKPNNPDLSPKTAIGSTATGDGNGNGKPDLIVKFDRSDLGPAVRGALVKYTVTVRLRNKDCPFSGVGEVQVMQ